MVRFRYEIFGKGVEKHMKKIIAFILAIVFQLSGLSFAVSAETGTAESKVLQIPGKFEYTEENCDITLIYPVFSGFKAASGLNNLIMAKNTKSLSFINDAWSSIIQAEEQYGNSGEGSYNSQVELNTYYDYSVSGNILSVLLTEYNYTGGAHGMTLLQAYTLNTATSESYSKFENLFNPKSDYKKVIVDKVNKMIDTEADLYFADAKQTVASKGADFKFYIDGSNVVIYFDLYDIRPYAGGIPKFKFSASELKGLLKDEVYTQLVNVKPLGNVRLNGTTLNVPYKVSEQNYVMMVPLKFFAETLGYTVTWDSKMGAGVSGGYIKNNVNSYYTEKTKNSPVKLTAPKTVDGRLYVPLAYFSEVLGENVFYDGETIRIFK